MNMANTYSINSNFYIISRMLARTFLQEDCDDIELFLKDHGFKWDDILSDEEFAVASTKKYFNEIAKNKIW